MDMTLIQAPKHLKQKTFAFGYLLPGQPAPDNPTPMDFEIVELPITKPDFEIRSGDEHPEAASSMRHFAEIVRCMASPCVLIGGPKPFIRDGGKLAAVTSDLIYVPVRRSGSNLLNRQPYILISTALTPFRPTPSQVRRMNGSRVTDSAGLPVSDLIGVEELLLQVGVWAAHEANRIWPDWLDRVWQSLRDDADPSRIVAGLEPIEEVLDAFVEFAITFLRNAALARSAVSDDVPFHTHEFARIVTGMFAREIMEHGDHLWEVRESRR